MRSRLLPLFLVVLIAVATLLLFWQQAPSITDILGAVEFASSRNDSTAALLPLGTLAAAKLLCICLMLACTLLLLLLKLS